MYDVPDMNIWGLQGRVIRFVGEVCVRRIFFLALGFCLQFKVLHICMMILSVNKL